jgi:hypothetical protein
VAPERQQPRWSQRLPAAITTAGARSIGRKTQVLASNLAASNLARRQGKDAGPHDDECCRRRQDESCPRYGRLRQGGNGGKTATPETKSGPARQRRSSGRMQSDPVAPHVPPVANRAWVSRYTAAGGSSYTCHVDNMSCVLTACAACSTHGTAPPQVAQGWLKKGRKNRLQMKMSLLNSPTWEMNPSAALRWHKIGEIDPLIVGP